MVFGKESRRPKETFLPKIQFADFELGYATEWDEREQIRRLCNIFIICLLCMT